MLSVVTYVVSTQCALFCASLLLSRLRRLAVASSISFSRLYWSRDGFARLPCMRVHGGVVRASVQWNVKFRPPNFAGIRCYGCV